MNEQVFLYFVILALVSLTGHAAAVSSSSRGRGYGRSGVSGIVRRQEDDNEGKDEEKDTARSIMTPTYDLPFFGTHHVSQKQKILLDVPWNTSARKNDLEPEAMFRPKSVGLKIVIPGKEVSIYIAMILFQCIRAHKYIVTISRMHL